MTLAFYGKSRRHRWVLALLVFATLLGAVAGGAFSLQQRAGAAPFSSPDENGPNDEPGQKDLTWLSINDAGLPTSLSVEWNWDITKTSGANTADGCALFDSDNDGFANFALCETWGGNPPAEISTRLFICNDSRVDRCAGPSEVTAFTSTCAVTVTSDDPFPAGDDYPNDTKATCTVQLADVGAGTGQLLNVCSYPSEQPNSDPSDCVLIPRDGKLTVTKVVDGGPNTCSDFSFSVNGGALVPFEPDCSNDVFVAPGTYTITEPAVADYATTYDNCSGIEITSGGTATCTITNTFIARAATITINKILDADGDLQTTNDQTYPAGWQYNATIANGGSLSGTSPYSTGTNGTVTIDVTPDADGSTVDIDEVLQAGYNFLDAVCKDAAGAPVGLLDSDQTISGIPVEDGDAIVCDFYNQLQVAGPLVVTKTGAGRYDKDVTWEIEKTTSTPTPTLNLPDDGSGNAQYHLEITRTDTPSNIVVSGTITVENPAANTETATVTNVTDSVAGAVVDCAPVTFPKTLAPGESFSCAYSIPGLSSIDPINNTATVTTTGPVAGNTANATINFTFSDVFHGPTTVDIVDDQVSPLPTTSTSTSTTVNYSRNLTCEGITNWSSETGQGSKVVHNIASLLDGGQTVDSDFADVTVTCQRPKLTLVKVVEGGDAQPADFELTIDGHGSANGKHSAYVSSNTQLGVSESDLPGYSFKSLVCGPDAQGAAVSYDGEAPGFSVTMPAGARDVTCTFTNEFDPATINVRKVVDLGDTVIPAGDPLLAQTFQICIQGTTAGASYLAGNCKTVGHNQVATWDDLMPGSYTISETPPGQNWAVTGDDGVSVTVATGETASERTITNTFLPGGLTVAKVVELGGAQLPANTSFTICISGPSYPLISGNPGPASCQVLSGAGSLAWNDLIPGTYTVHETQQLPAGYWEDPVISGTFAVTPGTTASTTDTPDVTVTNTLKKGSIRVTKTFDWQGAEPTGKTFEICLTGPSHLSEPPKVCQTVADSDGPGEPDRVALFENLAPGDYQVSEEGTNIGSKWVVTIDGTETTTKTYSVTPGQETAVGVTNTYQRGSLDVAKVVNWNGPEDTAQTFTICLVGPSYPLVNGEPGPASCKVFDWDGGVQTWSNLIPGDYTVVELTPTGNWAVTYTNQGVTVEAGSQPDTQNPDSTVTNTRATGALTVVKSVEWNDAPAEDGQDFRICIQGPSYPAGGSWPQAGACQDVNAGNNWTASWPSLQTGTYTVIESFPDGDGAEWDTTVDNGSGPQDSLTTTVDVTASSTAPLVVTYTNTLKKATLIIKKVYQRAAPEEPIILVDGIDIGTGTTAANTTEWDPLTVNANMVIDVAEVLPQGWLNSTLSSSGCGVASYYQATTIATLIGNTFSSLVGLGHDSEDGAGAKVSVAPGGTCTVTFTNTWSPAKIVVAKTVEWGATVNPPANPAFEICLFDAADLVNELECGTTDGSTPVEFDGLLPGSYVVRETAPGSSWSTTVDATPGLSTTVSVVEGDIEDVEVVNTFQPGALSVRKDVVLNGQAPEEFTICISGPSYPADATWPQIDACKTWSLADLVANQTKTWNNLLPGDYTVSEQDPGGEWHVAIAGTNPVPVEPGSAPTAPNVTVTNTRIIPLVVEKEGSGTYDKAWTVDKITTTPTINLPDDGTGQAEYEVTITSSIVNVQASGTITVTNPEGNPVDAVVESIDDAGVQFSNCTPLPDGTTADYSVVGTVAFTPALALGPGESVTCDYTIPGLTGTDTQGVRNTAAAVVTEDSDVPGASSSTIDISFTSNGPDSVDLEDVFDGGAPVSEGTELTDGVVKYSRDVTCEGITRWSTDTGEGSKTVLNTATILDGGEALGSDSAEVQVNCQRPKLTLIKEISDAFVPATEPLASPDDFDLTIGQAAPLSGDVTGAGSVFAYVSSGGTYPISESSLPGYKLVSLECTYLDEAGAPQSITVTQDASSSVTMPAGALDVTCTFTNEFDPGKITVTKVVDFSGAESEPSALFRICLFEDGAETSAEANAIACENVTGDPAGTPGNEAEFDNLLPGTYVVVEFFPNGDSEDWDVVLEPGNGEVTLVTTGSDGTATVTNTLKKGEMIVRKIYVGATATNADAPVVTVDGETPAHQGVVANASEWDAVEVSPYTAVDVSEDLKPGWKNIDIQYGDGCLFPEITSELDGLLDILSIVIGETPESLVETTAAVAPGGACVVTFTNEAFGTVMVEKIDQSANENEWDFEVNGPNEFSDTPHITGSDSVTYLDMPLGTYSAAETTEGILGSVEQCPFPNPNGEGTYVTATTPATQSLAQPGQAITFTFLNQDCPVVLGAGSLVIAKWSDLDADGSRDPGEPGVAGWKFTVAGPEFPGGQDFFTNSQGLVLGLDGITAGFYTVTEGTQAGWAQTALSINGAPQAVSPTALVEVKAGNNPDDWPLVEVAFGNRPPATVRVVKSVIDQVGNRDRSSWQFNLAGCGTSINGVTNANGEITWSNLLPAINCAYTVTELDTEGFSVSPSQAQVVAPGPGQVATVSFTNSRVPGETPIPTPTNTPTATPTPTETPTNTPTNTPEPTETVAGERTPGSIATPIAPDTGSGFAGPGAAGSLLMALLGLFAISGGMALFSLGRRRR